MGRSVNYHSNYQAIVYAVFECSDLEDASWEWDDFKGNVAEAIQNAWPSMERCDHRQQWHNNEVLRLMENHLCSVWISEYCGCVSLSFVADEPLGVSFINKGIAKVRKELRGYMQVMSKTCTFSNGESIYALD